MKKLAKSEKVKQLSKRVCTEKATVIDVGGRPIEEIEAEVRAEVAECEKALTKGLAHALKVGAECVVSSCRDSSALFSLASKRRFQPRRRYMQREQRADGVRLGLLDGISGIGEVRLWTKR